MVDYRILENMGGGTMCEFGKLKNGLYYALNEVSLAIYDNDIYNAYKELDQEEFDNWCQQNYILMYDIYDNEYQKIANESEYFKGE